MRRGEGGALGWQQASVYTHAFVSRPSSCMEEPKTQKRPRKLAETFFFVSEETYGSKLLGDP